MIRILRDSYLQGRFFLLMISCISLFILSYPFPQIFPIALASVLLAFSLLVLDVFLLFLSKSSVHAKRLLPPLLTLGDEVEIRIRVASRMNTSVKIEITDETPEQLQLRDLRIYTELGPGDSEIVRYTIRPTERGAHRFGDIRIFASGIIGLVQRRITIPAEEEMAVFPSVLQMRQYELKVFSKLTLTEGIKRVRRLGQSTEFEQIKNYVSGDDYRNINWKASARRSELMVNQYEDEKAQQVYCLIDKSRSMRMAFEGMTLLDYAINSSLVISNIAMRKSDRAGLMTFSDKLGTRLPAERNASQLKRIQEALYRQKTRFNEANFEMLYFGIRNYIKGRSLLLLFTNFESSYAVQRALPLLRRINQQHLLVVVFFENTELKEVTQMETPDLRAVYTKTVAQHLAGEKQLIAQELSRHAIQTILTTPEKLSVDTINKYLELKSRGMI
ncbi:MAG TPA: DUF58 domain-containing protein [Flavobacteriales bacterium]|nr:DUF58 domain-containing protein [Flavobacteriales bacterium]HRE97703.1 DUF58 domain-containing protein [Flavobacteriales bacterium]